MERCYWMEGAKLIRRIFETQILPIRMLPDSKYNVIVYKYFRKDYGSALVYHEQDPGFHGQNYWK